MIRLAVVTTLWHRRALAGVVLRHMYRVREELGREGVDLDLVAVVSLNEDKVLAIDSGWEPVGCPNEPLGEKWNRGVEIAALRDRPAGVVVIGSDDLVHADVFRAWARMLAADPAPRMLGLRDCLVYRPVDGRMMHWPGYPAGSPRHGESIGTARCLSAALLDALKWSPWDPSLNVGLDASMRAKVRTVLGDAHEVALPMSEVGPVIDVKYDMERVGIGSWSSMAAGSTIQSPAVADAALHAFPLETYADLLESCPAVPRGPAAFPPCEAPLCSAAMILRDAAPGIETCLRSLVGVVDEVVVILDTATTDRTREIVEAMGARVIERQWTDDFSAARNASLDACRGHWRLVIDGDEVLDEPGRLRELMEQHRDLDAISVFVVSEDDRTTREQRAVRVIGPSVRYRYPAHNEPFGITRLAMHDAVISTSYAGEVRAHAERTIPILLRMAAHPEYEGNPHAAFYLAQSYAAIEDWPAASRWAEESIRLAPDSPTYAAAWGVRARAAAAGGKTQDALRLSVEGLAVHPGYADLWHFAIALTVAGWHGAALRPGDHAWTPQESIAHAPNVQRAAQLLGLPLRFGVARA